MSSDLARIVSTRQARTIASIKRQARQQGITGTALEGVTLLRADRSATAAKALYEPSVVILVQGRKRGVHGGTQFVYDARHYLVLSVPLPFEVQTEASAQTPLLGLSLRVDPGTVAELLLELDPAMRPGGGHVAPTTMFATRLDEPLEDAVLRLVEALESPVEARVLGPGIVREIMYRVLIGEQGDGLRAALRPGGDFARLAGVLRRIHADYAYGFDVATLAHEAGMSVPAFHARFKAVTTTTPIQYIKAIRLHQARVLMIREGLTAAAAAGRVGYESPSQFSREFKRLFGRSPSDEVRQLRDLLAFAPAADAPVAEDAGLAPVT
ncbi:AraC family transcriptional regulator [Luteimonas abyssi]|uniref:AraC family transcriptional regulator n=1 Tax=Luteimonas abyssi TaxID=1247514 RepID=UPI000737BFBD|nr:AraC family transcriptional regulator [Luteimonas abyssi]